VTWHLKVREVWDRVRFVETGPTPAGPVTSGVKVPVRAAVDLAGLEPEDVRVEVVIGRVGASGGLEDTEVMVLPAVEKKGPVAIFAKEIIPQQTGRLGYALRISPNHYDDPLTRPCASLLKWGSAELVPANTLA
jgi:starch phosphorylase